jgi:hypothetical protein
MDTNEMIKKIPAWIVVVAVVIVIVVFLERVYISKKPFYLMGQVFGPALAEGIPVIDTPPEIAWQPAAIEMSQQACEEKAKLALTKAGYTGINRGGQVTFGYDRNYIGLIWCNAAKGTSFQFVSGPEWEIVERLSTELKRAF